MKTVSPLRWFGPVAMATAVTATLATQGPNVSSLASGDWRPTIFNSASATSVGRSHFETDADRFNSHLTDAYLAWAARLQDEGLWAPAEHLTVKALAAQRGERPAPTPLLQESLGGEAPALRAALERLSRLLLADLDRLGPTPIRIVAEAQAAYDCWAITTMDGGPAASVRTCRGATQTALRRLPKTTARNMRASVR